MAHDVTERATRPSADATRERILAAALDLSSELSFEGATTRRLSGIDPQDPGVIEAHADARSHVYLAPAMRNSLKGFS